MKKAIMLFAVIMITLTAYTQKSKIVKIKVFGLVTIDQYDRSTEEEVDGRMGIDLDNQIIYFYYESGSTIVHHYIVDRMYTCKDNYFNIEGTAKNAGSGKIAYMNIATHKKENIVIITIADLKTSMSFIGTIY